MAHIPDAVPSAQQPPAPGGGGAHAAAVAFPAISVVMPVLNEERYLADAVAHVLRQDYPAPVEVVLAVGPSRDRTREVAERLAAADPRVTVVDNPNGHTPAGLNAATRASRYPVVARVDGHALLSPGYLRVAAETLVATGADNVGGVMAAAGVTPFEQAVARAMTSKVGVGAARFHTGGQAGPADSVYLGVFRRSAIDRVGGYDEAFLRAQDWEMNHRIRASGGTVWFQPRMRVSYRPRANLGALCKQYLSGAAGRCGGDRGRPRRRPCVAHRRACRARGGTVTSVALPGLRPAGGVPVRGARRVGAVRARPAANRDHVAAGGARHDAHVLGRRVSHQPSRAGPGPG